MSGDRLPSVFTLVWPADLARYGRYERSFDPPRLLVFRSQLDGRVTVDDFPDEVDVCEGRVACLEPSVVWMARGRLYIRVANGEAVYVPVGPSPVPRCTRYGRLYLRPAEGA